MTLADLRPPVPPPPPSGAQSGRRDRRRAPGSLQRAWLGRPGNVTRAFAPPAPAQAWALRTCPAGPGPRSSSNCGGPRVRLAKGEPRFCVPLEGPYARGLVSICPAGNPGPPGRRARPLLAAGGRRVSPTRAAERLAQHTRGAAPLAPHPHGAPTRSPAVLGPQGPDLGGGDRPCSQGNLAWQASSRPGTLASRTRPGSPKGPTHTRALWKVWVPREGVQDVRGSCVPPPTVPPVGSGPARLAPWLGGGATVRAALPIRPSTWAGPRPLRPSLGGGSYCGGVGVTRLMGLLALRLVKGRPDTPQEGVDPGLVTRRSLRES